MINLRLWPNYSKKKNFCSLKLEIFKLGLIGTLRVYGVFLFFWDLSMINLSATSTLLSTHYNKPLVSNKEREPDSLLSQGVNHSAQTTGVVNIKEQLENDLHESVRFQIISKMMSNKSVEQGEYKKNTQQTTDNKKSNINDSVFISEQASNLFVQSEQRASLSISKTGAQIEQEKIPRSDPLALDLNGDGLQTTGVVKGILFDINGDGHQEQLSFINGGDAFLAYDRNGNGLIDSGKELFGDNNGYQHGFAELASYDDNHDGKIDSSDKIYEQLTLLSIDDNAKQHISDLQSSDIAAIHLAYSAQEYALNQYDSVTQVGQFEYKNGAFGLSGDIMLGYKNR